MKKLLKTLLWILGIIIAIILIGGLFMPAKTELAVSKVIEANLYPTFKQVNCLKANANWCPWQNVKNISYSGPECGEGATMTWEDDMGGEGLKNLDSVLNHMAEDRYKIKYEDVKPQPLLSITGSADMENMSEVMPKLFMKLGSYMGENQIQPLGSPVTIWESWSDSISEMTVGFPVNEEVEGNGDIKVIQSYSGKALNIIHKGAYADQHKTWQILMDNIDKMGLEATASPWEVYLTDPQTEKDTSKWLTKMYQPVK